jgi:hypothetical protein
MKVRVALVLEVDADEWARNYGMDGTKREVNALVRDDVKSFIGNLVAETRHHQDGLITEIDWS